MRAEEPSRGYWRELWERRGLLLHFARRDLQVRYKQTALGILWGLIRPFLSMGAFTIIFSMVARLPTHGATAYPLMVLAGLLPWQLFATAILHASSSLTWNASIFTRVYFPRLILPAAALLTGVVDFLIGLAVLVALLFAEGHAPTWRVVLIPVFGVMALLAAAGIGTAIAALNVRYRDFGYLTPFLLQVGLFISPVGFISGSVPDQWAFVYGLNPMVGVIDGFRWALLDPPGPLRFELLALSLGMSLVALVLGVWIFRRAESTFVDDV